MCGFLGMFGPQAHMADVENVQRVLTHRGPDDAGTYRGKNAVIGFQRLSFLDLSPSGHQPMRFGDIIIVFNGEVYNFRDIRAELEKLGHKFISSGDTETVLHAYAQWGPGCLAKFIGMYAFVIVNTATDEVFMARDRLGVKPLYYATQGENLLVASEVQGLIKLGLRPSWNWKAIQRQTVLTSYYGYEEGEIVLAEVYELPPATYGIRKPGEKCVCFLNLCPIRRRWYFSVHIMIFWKSFGFCLSAL